MFRKLGGQRPRAMRARCGGYRYAIGLWLGIVPLRWRLRHSKPFPRGEGAPVRTLGRMRNSDIFHYQMQLVKKVKIMGYYRLSQAQSAMSHLAVPHPARRRRSTFPRGEGFRRCPPNPNLQGRPFRHFSFPHCVLAENLVY